MAHVETNHAESAPLFSFPPAPPNGTPPSIMRKFLKSGVDFKWPDHAGQCSGSHCVLSGPQIPLTWKRRIADTKGASIDVYQGGSGYIFKEPFVVKTIRGSDEISSRTKAAKEVENMRDLRHPHVAALLGTFSYLQRLSILIYPVARCDLHQFLRKISNELKISGENLSDASHSPASTNSAHSTSSPGAGSKREAPGHNGEEDYPLDLAFPKRIELLRRYFICLSQALNYLHESDIRHKDIKPANILIDSSGSVILTDFGISRRFAKSSSHVTNDRWDWTRKYASPEIMKGKKVPRDDRSDIFSLGCVFLEMMTIILGKDQEEFCAFYGRNESDAYYLNLEMVHQWIAVLEKLKQPAGTSSFDASLTNENIESHHFMPDLDQGIMDSLDTIRRMLSEDPLKRPIAKGLWRGFQALSPRICDDCDERNESKWSPSIRQQQQHRDSGVSALRSQHKIQSPELAIVQNSRISSELMTRGYHLRQSRDSLFAVNKQIPNTFIDESVSIHPNSINNSQANPDKPNSSRSVRSDSHHPGLPLSLGVSGSDLPTESNKFGETQNGTEVNFYPRSARKQHIPKPNFAKTVENRKASEEKLLPSTKIIIYDGEKKFPFVAPFRILRGAR